MTKKKRFVQNTNLVMQNNEVYVVCGDEHSADVVTTALNELINENEQLKAKNNAYFQDIEVFKKENTTLKLENEWLKEENQELHQLNREYVDSLPDKEKEALSKMLNIMLGDDKE